MKWPRRGMCCSRAWHFLSDRARRRSKVEGNLLHSCRRVRSRRDEARADCPHRGDRAGHHCGCVRRVVRQTSSNVQEVCARGGKSILLTDADGLKKLGSKVWASIELPKIEPFVAPIIYAIAVQLLAYHAAVAKGTDN